MEKIYFKLANTQQEIRDMFMLRKDVFSTEQGIPAELDKDDKDDTAIHVIALFNKKIIGTGRVFIQNHQGHISRIAIDKDFRKKGLGKKVVLELISLASGKNVSYIYLYPHAHLETFYESLGFAKIQGYSEKIAGHSIIKMDMTLNIHK